MSLHPYLQSARTAEAERFLHDGNTSIGDFVDSLEPFAQDLANAVNKVIRAHGLIPYVIGTGGDFQEFAAPFIRELERPYGYGVGCLWPYQSKPNHRGIRPIYFDQEYLEKTPAEPNFLIVVQSVINDLNPIAAVVERALELKPDMNVLIVAGAGSRMVERRISEIFRDRLRVISAASMPEALVTDVELNYWTVAESLDRREFKYAPKLALQLLGRLDASYDERFRDDWRLPPGRRFDL